MNCFRAGLSCSATNPPLPVPEAGAPRQVPGAANTSCWEMCALSCDLQAILGVCSQGTCAAAVVHSASRVAWGWEAGQALPGAVGLWVLHSRYSQPSAECCTLRSEQWNVPSAQTLLRVRVVWMLTGSAFVILKRAFVSHDHRVRLKPRWWLDSIAWLESNQLHARPGRCGAAAGSFSAVLLELHAGGVTAKGETSLHCQHGKVSHLPTKLSSIIICFLITCTSL